jgi:hypothetical protein
MGAINRPTSPSRDAGAWGWEIQTLGKPAETCETKNKEVTSVSVKSRFPRKQCESYQHFVIVFFLPI